MKGGINMYDFCFKFWNDRKEKTKHRQLNFNYYMELLEKMIQCFDYENIPDGIDPKFLELYLLLNGTVGIAKSQVNTDKLICFIGGYCGDIDEYGIGKSYTGATVGGTYEGVINKEIAVGINNSVRMGRTNLLDRYSGLLANIEESIGIGLINSRMLPIIECKNDKDVEQIKSISKQMKNGELTAVSSKQIDIFSESIDTYKPIELFKSADVNKLQYYSRFYEETLKRLWLETGIEITDKDKSAQVNADELHSFSKYSRITIEDMLHCREKMCDDINTLFNTNMSVKLNHIFDNDITVEDGIDLIDEINNNVSRETLNETKGSAEDGTGNNEYD